MVCSTTVAYIASQVLFKTVVRLAIVSPLPVSYQLRDIKQHHIIEQ